MRIDGNKNLREPFTKRPKCRETNNISWRKAKSNRIEESIVVLIYDAANMTYTNQYS